MNSWEKKYVILTKRFLTVKKSKVRINFYQAGGKV